MKLQNHTTPYIWGIWNRGIHTCLLAITLATVMLLQGCGGGGGAATPTYTIGGSVTGLTGTVVLQNNGGDDLTISGSSFTFTTELTNNSSYAVSVLTQPSGQVCTVTNGSDTVTGTDVTTISVSCVDRDTWTWISGSNTASQIGTYGTKGTPAAANVPGARSGSIVWNDSTGNLWLFGGNGQSSFDSGSGLLNDLWRWDGNNWTWISGSNDVEQSGSYGTKGTVNSANVPGARRYSVSWIGSTGNLWLFGGRGFDSAGVDGRLNDLWRWDGSNWTWISGSSTTFQIGIYGAKGTANSANVPGARRLSGSWIDASGNLWIFGGRTQFGLINDLWRWDGTNWTWISGGNVTRQSGSYGIKGTAAAINVPGSREDAISWVDASGNMWLFGGVGHDSVGTLGNLNDLWRWDGSNWTWVSGSNLADQSSSYGTKGTVNTANVPGARRGSITWTDFTGNQWLFGGEEDNAGSVVFLNDLWRWDGSNWTWVSGSNTGEQFGIYGTKGIADAANIPGSRRKSVSWIDSTGKFWLFGGTGRVSSGAGALFNDLWRYQP